MINSCGGKNENTSNSICSSVNTLSASEGGKLQSQSTQPPQNLIEAITQSNLEAVKSFVEQGADVNEGIMFIRSAGDDIIISRPILEAIKIGEASIVMYLLEKGVDLNMNVYDPNTEKYCEVGELINSSDPEIIAILEKYMEEKGYFKYFQKELNNAIQNRDIVTAEKILKSQKATMDNVDTYLLLYRYEQDENMMALIKKYGSADIANGNINLLNYLLKHVDGDICSRTHKEIFIGFPLPLATSSLFTEQDLKSFRANKAFDGNSSTAWVEGVDGPGIGQKIAFEIEPSVKQIIITPAVVNNQFTKNSRIKKASFHLFYYLFHGVEGDIFLDIEDAGYQINLDFEDSPVPQKFNLQLPENILKLYNEKIKDISPETLFAVIEILEVYEGPESSNTGIAEIICR